MELWEKGKPVKSSLDISLKKFLKQIKRYNKALYERDGDMGCMFLNDNPKFWKKHKISNMNDWHKKITARKKPKIRCTCKKNPDKCEAFHPWLVYKEWIENVR